MYNPASGEVVARVPRGGASEVDAAVEAATVAFQSWRDSPLIARSQILFACRELVYRHGEKLAALITRDHGKTFPDALAEVMRGLETVEFACGLPVHLAGANTANVSTNVDALTFRQPLAVTAGITPFNFPAMVPMWIYPIALMTGDTFILEALLPYPWRHTIAGGAVEGSGASGWRLPRRVRWARGGHRDRPASRHRHHPVRRLHPGRTVRLRDWHQAGQAGGHFHERQVTR